MESLKPTELISAQVILPTKQPVSEAQLTAEHLAAWLPDPSVVAAAQEAYAQAGFSVGPGVGISFSLTAAVTHFEKLFATRLRRTDAEGITCTAGTSLPLDKLPPALARHVETIVFPPPPEFGPTDFH